MWSWRAISLYQTIALCLMSPSALAVLGDHKGPQYADSKNKDPFPTIEPTDTIRPNEKPKQTDTGSDPGDSKSSGSASNSLSHGGGTSIESPPSVPQKTSISDLFPADFPMPVIQEILDYADLEITSEVTFGIQSREMFSRLLKKLDSQKVGDKIDAEWIYRLGPVVGGTISYLNEAYSRLVQAHKMAPTSKTEVRITQLSLAIERLNTLRKSILDKLVRLSAQCPFPSRHHISLSSDTENKRNATILKRDDTRLFFTIFHSMILLSAGDNQIQDAIFKTLLNLRTAQPTVDWPQQGNGKYYNAATFHEREALLRILSKRVSGNANLQRLYLALSLQNGQGLESNIFSDLSAETKEMIASFEEVPVADSIARQLNGVDPSHLALTHFILDDLGTNLRTSSYWPLWDLNGFEGSTRMGKADLLCGLLKGSKNHQYLLKEIERVLSSLDDESFLRVASCIPTSAYQMSSEIRSEVMSRLSSIVKRIKSESEPLATRTSLLKDVSRLPYSSHLLKDILLSDKSFIHNQGVYFSCPQNHFVAEAIANVMLQNQTNEELVLQLLKVFAPAFYRSGGHAMPFYLNEWIPTTFRRILRDDPAAPTFLFEVMKSQHSYFSAGLRGNSETGLIPSTHLKISSAAILRHLYEPLARLSAGSEWSPRVRSLLFSFGDVWTSKKGPWVLECFDFKAKGALRDLEAAQVKGYEGIARHSAGNGRLVRLLIAEVDKFETQEARCRILSALARSVGLIKEHAGRVDRTLRNLVQERLNSCTDELAKFEAVVRSELGQD